MSSDEKKEKVAPKSDLLCFVYFILFSATLQDCAQGAM